MAKESKAFTYEDLDVYQAGLDVAEAIYRLTELFPKSEQYGITSQMRRCAVSISSNIAEGWGRGPGAANAQFVRIGRGSIYELVTLVNLSIRLGFITTDHASAIKPLLEKTGKLIQAYLASLESKLTREHRAQYGTEDQEHSTSEYQSPIASR
jgi:four helix bundle protein